MTAVIAAVVQALSESMAVSVVLKVTLATGVALVAVRCARTASASLRHLILVSALAISLALPLASAVMPSVWITVRAAPRTEAAAGAARTEPAPRAGGQDSRPLDSAHDSRVSLSAWAFLVWAVGAAVCLLPVGLGLRQMRRLRRWAIPWMERHGEVQRLSAEFGLGRRIDLLLHEAVRGPVTCGVLRSAIVFPAAAQAWSDDDVRRAVVHELAHVWRGDWLVNGLARAICALYWFHPLVWACARGARLEAERACDDVVLRREDPVQYAAQLVALARRMAAGGEGPLVAMANRGDLATRVAAVLEPRVRRAGLRRPHRMVAALAAAVGVLLLAPVRVTTQAGATIDLTADVAFEVASLRRNVSGDPARGRREPGGRFTATGTPVITYIRMAFGGLPDDRILRVPDWVRSERYDLVAKVPDGSELAMGQLLRSLLRDRFGFAAHVETRDLPTYELVVARRDGGLGPALQPASCDCTGDQAEAGCRQGPPLPSFPEFNGPSCALLGQPGRRVVRGYPMSTVAQSLGGLVERVVIDKTGLAGVWNLEVTFTDPLANPDAAGGLQPSDEPSLFTALQEQLGLRLEPSRGPVDVLVIDRIERPTEN